MITCRGPECERPVENGLRGLCKTHSAQELKGKELKPIRSRVAGGGKECQHEGCTSIVRSRGYCGRHYRQFYRYGKTWGEGSVGCSVKDCSRPECARSLCEYHYFRSDKSEWKVEGDICGVIFCDNISGRGAVCPKHRTRILRFNLTVEDFFRLIGDGSCNACGVKAAPGAGDHHIHHDHNCCPTSGRSCGKCVVAYLCSQCNCAAGQAGDDSLRLRAIADVIDSPPFKKGG